MGKFEQIVLTISRNKLRQKHPLMEERVARQLFRDNFDNSLL